MRAHGQTHAFSIATLRLHYLSGERPKSIRWLLVLREHAALVNRGPGSRRPALAATTPAWARAMRFVGTTSASGATSALETALENACRAPTAQCASSTGAATVHSRRRRASCLDHADARDNVGTHNSAQDISLRKVEKSAPDHSSASESIACQAHSSDAGGAISGAPVSANLGTQPYSAAGRPTSRSRGLRSCPPGTPGALAPGARMVRGARGARRAEARAIAAGAPRPRTALLCIAVWVRRKGPGRPRQKLAAP